jgi:triosephosphate isomerase
MNPTNIDDALDLVRGVMSVARGQADKVEVAIFPPFPYLVPVSDLLVESGVKLGAQDTFWEMSGAFTGEVSPAMLKPLCQWVIVGHSERRVHLGETDEMVAKKTAAALSCEMSVIMCVGELIDHYDAGTSDTVVSSQVKAGLARCSADDSARLVIAYEPVWAIGTGRNADPEHAYKTLRLIRKIVGEMDRRGRRPQGARPLRREREGRKRPGVRRAAAVRWGARRRREPRRGRVRAHRQGHRRGLWPPLARPGR